MKLSEPLQQNNRLVWVERLAKLLDNQFRFPGTNFRFGLDPILNLVPILGDVSGFLLSLVLLATMLKHGVSRKLVILMALNILIDTVIGAIPLIGNIFDFYFKSNARNIRLLREHYEEGKHQGSGWGLIIGVFLFLFAILGVLIYLLIKLGDWLFGLF